MVVFRGTRLHVHNLMDVAELVIINQSDLWIDSLFLPAVCRVGGRVHSGFLKAFAEVSDDARCPLEGEVAGEEGLAGWPQSGRSAGDSRGRSSGPGCRARALHLRLSAGRRREIHQCLTRGRRISASCIARTGWSSSRRSFWGTSMREP